METSLRTLRMIRLFMLGSILLYAGIAERLGPKASRNNPIFFYAIAAVAVSMVGMVFAIRLMFIPRQAMILAAKPEDGSTLRKWQALHVIIYALCEAIALYGLVLRFVGFTFAQIGFFYLAGFALMLFSTPKQPTSAIG